MRIYFKFFLINIFTVFLNPIFAQPEALRLSHEEFIAAVKKYHPLVLRSVSETQIAIANVQQAKGNFDPMLDGKIGSKTIDGTNYYKESNVGLVIPTWYGIELKGAYNYLEGEKLNNSDTRGGLYQFGLTVPLAQNLLYDKRRALVEQSKLSLQMTEAEQRVLINELLLEADNMYWTWVKDYHVFLLQCKSVEINKKRLDLTKKLFSYGERAAVDTVEAMTQLQSFELDQQEAYLQFVKSTQELSLFLWKDNGQPYDIIEGIIPSDDIVDQKEYYDYHELLFKLESKSIQNHASMLYYSRKQDLLDSERRIKFQSLLPKVNFTYNFLNKENYSADFLPLFNNNYQYGLKLEIPIFLTQARADYRAAKLKYRQNQLDFEYKNQEIKAKVNTYKNQILNYRSQLNIATRNIDNYSFLLKSEEVKFSNGESSLFLINSREKKLIDAEIKLLQLRLKFLESYNTIKWLNENFSEQ